MADLRGAWTYQSYHPTPGSVPASPTAPTFAPWSPKGDVTINEAETEGTLAFPGMTLSLTIQVTPGTPKRVSISATGVHPVTGESFTNELQGWVVPSDLTQPAAANVVVRGAILQSSPFQGGAPIFTTGFFVLQR